MISKGEAKIVKNKARIISIHSSLTMTMLDLFKSLWFPFDVAFILSYHQSVVIQERSSEYCLGK